LWIRKALWLFRINCSATGSTKIWCTRLPACRINGCQWWIMRWSVS
jgi:hypothetical protein